MGTAGGTRPGTVLADLELTRGLAVQMSAVGPAVAIGLLGALYQAVTGQAASFQFAPAGVGAVFGLLYAFV